eukprot:TRINITY_DN4774_c0_g1_i1.p1 TRINITY_DN4774_c0_g1~~TRINITY_DN4774_c0_g1_i1.p1  ORF type:complete len:880 (-),score=341.75 TRINITY_DN4774_c0_g1_i1:499-3102(-)
MKVLICLLLLVCVFARPIFEKDVHPSMRANAVNEDEEGFITNSFKHVDEFGKHTRMDYHAKVSNNVVSLDSMEEIEAVHCNGNKMTLEFNNDDVAANTFFAEGTIFVGGHEWGCKNEKGGDAIIMHEVISHRNTEGQIVAMVKPAAVSDCFQHLKLNYSSDNYELQSVKPTKIEIIDDDEEIAAMKNGNVNFTATERRNLGFWDWMTDLGHKVKAVAQKLSGYFAGNFSHQWTKAFEGIDHSIDQDVPLPGSLSPYFEVHLNAGFTLQPTVVLSMDIEDWSLNDLKAYSVLSGSGTVGATFTLLDQEIEKAARMELGEIDSPTIRFSIGVVPVWMKFNIPFSGGFSVQATGGGSVHASYEVDITAKGGVQYNQYSGLDYIHSVTFDHTPDMGEELHASGEIGVYLDVQLFLELFNIGGPYVVLRNALILDVTAEQSSGGGGSLKANLDYFVGYWVGAKIAELKLAGKTIWEEKDWATEPKGLYRKTIASKCYKYGSSTGCDSDNALPAPKSTFSTDLSTQCPLGCGNGSCISGKCVCSEGFTGAKCDTAIPVPAPKCDYESCVVAEGLQTCAEFNGKPICASSVESLIDIDNQIQGQLVSAYQEGPRCLSNLRALYCHEQMPLCNQEDHSIHRISFESCEAAFGECGVAKNVTTLACTMKATSPAIPFAKKSEEAERDLNAIRIGKCQVRENEYCSSEKAVFIDDETLVPTQIESLMKQQFAESSENQECKNMMKQMICSEFYEECDENEAPMKMCAEACVGAMLKCSTTHEEALEICLSAPNVAKFGDKCGYGHIEESVAGRNALKTHYSKQNADDKTSAPKGRGSLLVIGACCCCIAALLAAVAFVILKKKNEDQKVNTDFVAMV